MKGSITISDKSLMAIAIGLCMQNCVEPLELQHEESGFESMLVVQATITDENKLQEVRLSRTFPLDTTGIYGEGGAMVQVTDSDGGMYDFTYQGEGRYVSSASFAARTGIGYRLNFITSDGKEYISEEEIAPAPTQIDSLYTERDFRDGDLDEGIFIYADSFDPTGQNKFFRYEYEETYKIIAPYWNAVDLYIRMPLPDLVVAFKLKEQEERVCFGFEKSSEIIQQNSGNFSNNRITKFPVRFINKDNFIISHRYSILVKQHVQSQEAYAYYKALEELFASNGVLSQIQTGFLEGSITALDNPEEQVIGFFEVSSVSEKRLFFDYVDYFPDLELPKYISECTFYPIPIDNYEFLNFTIENGYKFYEFGEGADLENPEELGEAAPFVMVTPACGDCTKLGSNIAPDFWIEQ
ncbi:DUF4249 domain-containing protein [Maribacter sp. PR1]|uniref:DUF4249 domain-containing protein n=1 Tax=Maribacter cobaltidurans TaxID=1178778 RepID=A0ABU7IVS1_9FLAO|nr:MULTISPECIES: DUF4249 domain-containing protein [Maribacter]MDC6389644.1 DUF4249 domain-containing protein [Maribacter sp. PR1]MEE1977033.1 DUF4249 domain-containing protein [Maribacter cobaltidurans]